MGNAHIPGDLPVALQEDVAGVDGVDRHVVCRRGEGGRRGFRDRDVGIGQKRLRQVVQKHALVGIERANLEAGAHAEKRFGVLGEDRHAYIAAAEVVDDETGGIVCGDFGSQCPPGSAVIDGVANLKRIISDERAVVQSSIEEEGTATPSDRSLVGSTRRMGARRRWPHLSSCRRRR